MFRAKKSIELSLTVVVVAAILLFTAIVILAVFKGLIGKEAEQAHGLIGDADGDNILNMADKCPCNSGVSEFEGCESEEQLNQYTENPTKIDRSCVTKQEKT